MDAIRVVGGAVVALALVAMLLLGVVGPAWDGTAHHRETFWIVFLPCLAFLLAIAFVAGRVFG